jgi:UDP-N-acetylmuramate--alanine ligase
MFEDKSVYLVGIKGTGMTALAELLVQWNAHVSGSDVPDKFYTDEILQNLGVPYYEKFSRDNLPESSDVVVYSAAYSPEDHPELKRAAQIGIPTISYPEFLGTISAQTDSSAVAGVHGKTTTTALAGSLIKELGLPASVLVGSGVAAFGGRSTYVAGNRYFVAETCEYRRHFLHFKPRRIVLTSIEPDHLDYFSDFTDILQAFLDFIDSLPQNGVLIYCADDDGAKTAAESARELRPDLRYIPYGERAVGRFRVSNLETGGGMSSFLLDGFGTRFKLRVPGKHTVLNSAAAVALVDEILRSEGREISEEIEKQFESALYSFAGSKRRSEIVGEASGILFVDDYGHHPTAVSTTLKGYKSFYPGKRIVVDFMSHTYSRTRALLTEFASAFTDADLVILHKIYASAREEEQNRDPGGIDGKRLFDEVKKNHPTVEYFEEFDSAFPFLLNELRSGDVFITMGAGDNWKLGKRLYEHFQSKTDDRKEK